MKMVLLPFLQETKWMALSVAIHFAIFKILVIQFPPLPEEWKPEMTFLGGFLRSYDLSTLSNNTAFKTVSPKNAFIPISVGASRFTPHAGSSRKPHFSKVLRKEVKGTVPLIHSAQTKKKPEATDLGIATMAPQYIPLRLDNLQ